MISRGVLRWDHPHTDCVPSAFGGRTGFDVDTSHVFPQGVRLVCRSWNLCRVWAGLLCSVAIPTVRTWGESISSQAGMEALRVSLELALFLEVCFSFFLHWGLCSEGGGC